MQQCWPSSHHHMKDTHAMYLQAPLTHIFQWCRSSKGSSGARLQNDRGATALLQETLLVSPHLPSSGHFMQLLSARRCNPWPPVCSHPFPLLSLAPCWGPGSLQAWGVGLLQPTIPTATRFLHPLLGRSNEHIISLAPCQQELTRGPRGLLAQTGGWGVR